MAKDTEVKFSEDEMAELQKLQQTYQQLQNAFGGVSVQRLRLEGQDKELNDAEAQVKSQFSDNQTKEQEFVKTINAKYGDGNLNLETGVFSPKPVEEVPDKTL